MTEKTEPLDPATRLVLAESIANEARHHSTNARNYARSALLIAIAALVVAVAALFW